MVTDRLPPDAGTPDITALLYIPPNLRLRDEDYGRLLRCYLREVLRTAMFMNLCGAGYLSEHAAPRLPQGVRLRHAPVGVGLPLVLPQNGASDPLALFIVQLVGGAAIMALELMPHAQEAHLRPLNELEFFKLVRERGIEPPAALKCVHDTLWSAAIAESSDREEPLARRLENIGKQIECDFRARGLPW